MVAAASAGAAAVRKADPVHYPPAPHAYFRLAEHELSAPQLCAVCFERVEPNNLFQVLCSTVQCGGCFKQLPTGSIILLQADCIEWDCLCLQRGSCCEVCGVVAHESCARHLPDDCRPISLPAEKVLHTWKAAGTVLIEEQASFASYCCSSTSTVHRESTDSAHVQHHLCAFTVTGD